MRKSSQNFGELDSPPPEPMIGTLVQKRGDSFFEGTKDFISNNEITTHLKV